MTQEPTPTCDCKAMSCKEGCIRNHTHKGFFCEQCEPVGTPLPSIEEIVEEFIKMWVSATEDDKTLAFAFVHTQQAAEMVDWLRSTLTARDEAVVELVEGMKHECPDARAGCSLPETREHEIRYSGHNQALDNIITALTKDTV